MAICVASQGGCFHVELAGARGLCRTTAHSRWRVDFKGRHNILRAAHLERHQHPRAYRTFGCHASACSSAPRTACGNPSAALPHTALGDTAGASFLWLREQRCTSRRSTTWARRRNAARPSVSSLDGACVGFGLELVDQLKQSNHAPIVVWSGVP